MCHLLFITIMAVPCVCRELYSLQQIFTSIILGDLSNNPVRAGSIPDEKTEAQRD